MSAITEPGGESERIERLIRAHAVAVSQQAKYNGEAVPTRNRLSEAVEVTEERLRAALRAPAAVEAQPEGERIEGWVPNWGIPEGGAMLRGVMKPVALPDRGCEFYAGPKPFTSDEWTRATLIVRSAPQEQSEPLPINRAPVAQEPVAWMVEVCQRDGTWARSNCYFEIPEAWRRDPDMRFVLLYADRAPTAAHDGAAEPAGVDVPDEPAGAANQVTPDASGAPGAPVKEASPTNSDVGAVCASVGRETIEAIVEEIEGVAFLDGDAFCAVNGANAGETPCAGQRSYTFVPECEHESADEMADYDRKSLRATLVIREQGAEKANGGATSDAS